VNVDTSVLEEARKKVESLDIKKMREGVKELEIAGYSWDAAATMIASMTMKFVYQALSQSCGKIISGIGGIAAGAVIGLLVSVVWEAISGAIERAELERRITELTGAEAVIRENRIVIADSCKKLYKALILMDVLRESA